MASMRCIFFLSKGHFVLLLQNPQNNDLFAYQLDFETKNRFDGNIAGQSWRNKRTSGVNHYSYTYDEGKRLRNAHFNGFGNFSTPLVSYDLNGNVQQLHRNGTSDSLNKAVDRLQYFYSGNKLLAVTDTVTWNANSGDFRDGNTSGNDFDYYSSGNLKADLNQGITSILYDSYLNLPTQINLSGGRWIKKYYDGAGNLLKRENSAGETWIYVGSIIYRNDSLYQTATPEGRAIMSNGKFQHEFEYRDRLGNLRLSLRDTTTGSPAVRSAALIAQVADYYPFGMQHSSYTLDSLGKQKFQFSNYESEEEFDLANINFGQRVYNPTIGRFDKNDRFSEKYYTFSNYSYALNNPIRFIDPDGNMAVPFDDYRLGRDGQIKLVKRTTDQTDRLYNADKTESIEVSKGTLDRKVVDLNQTPTSYNYAQEIFVTGNNKDAVKVFEFASENSKVEFGLDKVELNGKEVSVLKTNHKRESVDKSHLTAMEEAGFKVKEVNHSHPGNDPIPSGFNEKGLPGRQQGGYGRDGDIRTAQRFPNAIHRVYNPLTKKYTIYDKNKAIIPN